MEGLTCKTTKNAGRMGEHDKTATTHRLVVVVW